MLEASLLPPLPEEILRQTEARVEETLGRLPYLGKVVTRQEMTAKTANDRRGRSAYELLSDTATVLGMTEREISNDVARIEAADLFASIQVLHLPCPSCDQDARIAVVAQIFDARNAQLLWRAHLSRAVANEADAQALGTDAEELTVKLVDMIEYAIKPKWHRQRFDQLRRIPAEPQPQS